MKIQTNTILQILENKYRKDTFIITGLLGKEFYNKEEKRNIKKWYVALTDFKTQSPAFEIGVPENVIEKIRNNNLTFKQVQLSNFVDLEIGLSDANKWSLNVWFKAQDFNISIKQDNS